MIKENKQLFNRLNLLIEGAVLEISLVICYCICYYLIGFASAPMTLSQFAISGLVLLPIYILVYSFFKTYTPMRAMSYGAIVSKTLSANSIVIIPVIILLLAMRWFYSTWLLLIFYYFVCLFMMILKRVVVKFTISSLRKRGVGRKTLIITGGGKPAMEYLKAVKETTFEYKFIGYVADDESLDGEYLGGYDELYDILNNLQPDELVCTLDNDNLDKLKSIVENCEKTGTRISIIPYGYPYLPSNASIDQVGDIPLINLRQIPLDNNGKAFIKRIVDIFGSFIILILSIPLFIILSILIKCSSKGPVIFKQQRVGKDKKIFTMYKFRTMVVNSDEKTGWTTENDPRKTRIGSFLRKFSLDEWPQFFNVFKGDMSLVGPRPEIPYHVADFQKEVPRYMVKHQVKPGVTGLAQVSGWRGNTSIEKRIEYDIYYIENWTLMLDIFILFRTLFSFKNNEKLADKKKNGILFAASESCNTLENKNEATINDKNSDKKVK